MAPRLLTCPPLTRVPSGVLAARFVMPEAASGASGTVVHREVRSMSVSVFRSVAGSLRAGHPALAAFAAVLIGRTLAVAAVPASQPVLKPQSFALSDAKDVVVHDVTAEPVAYKGRKAMRLTTAGGDRSGFAVLPGTDFQDGIIEADIALKTTTPPGMRMPGFVGIAFRMRSDASRYELFYLRPGNSGANDQAMRNHSVQYTSEPDNGWERLRREWPSIYESWADLQMETWTKVRIEVKGRGARLYLNGSENPSLIVDGLKGEDLHGSVALWSYSGEEAYFSNVRITNAVPLPVENGAESTGTWQVRFPSDAGLIEGSMQLRRDGNQVSGTWSGVIGDARPVSGTWRDGYVELSFDADWPADPPAKGEVAKAVLAGWIDGNSARGRMKVVGHADGPWTATRKP